MAERVAIIATGKDAGATAVLGAVRREMLGINRAAAAASVGMSTFGDATFGHFRRVTGAILNLQNALTALIALGATKSVLDPAIEMETFETQFETLLGRMDLAKDRMGELSDFAKATPFQLPQLTQANLVLDNLTKGVLSTMEGMRLVGDVSAGVGGKGEASIERLAVWFGRLYDGIANGTPVGEAMARLQELGIVTGGVRRQVESLQKANADSATIWGVVVQAMKRYEGGMEKLSQKTGGKLSTLADNWEAVRRDVGEGALPGLNDAIDQLMAKLGEMSQSGELAKWGKDLGDLIANLTSLLIGLAQFVADHRKALATLGFSYGVFRIIRGASLAIAAVRASLAATAGEATRTAVALSAVKSAAASIGTMAVSVAVTYFIRRVYQDIEETRVAQGDAKRAMEQTPGLFINAAGNPESSALSKRDIAAAKAARDARLAKEGKNAVGKDIEEEAKKEANARRKASDAVASEIEAELPRRKELDDAIGKASDLEDKIAKQRAQAAQDRADLEIQTRIEANNDRLDALRAESDTYTTALQQLKKDEDEALKRLLDPEYAKQQDEEDKDMKRLERRIKAARKRQDAGLHVTAKGQKALAYDDLRKERIATEDRKGGVQAEIKATEARVKAAQDELAIAQRTQAEKAIEAAEAAAELQLNLTALNKEIERLAAQVAKGELAGATDANLQDALAKAQAQGKGPRDPAELAAMQALVPGFAANGLPGTMLSNDQIIAQLQGGRLADAKVGAPELTNQQLAALVAEEAMMARAEALFGDPLGGSGGISSPTRASQDIDRHILADPSVQKLFGDVHVIAQALNPGRS